MTNRKQCSVTLEDGCSLLEAHAGDSSTGGWIQPLSSGTNSVCNTEMFSCLARLCILPESGLAAILLKRRYVCKRIACFDNFLPPQRVLCPGPACQVFRYLRARFGDTLPLCWCIEVPSAGMNRLKQFSFSSASQGSRGSWKQAPAPSAAPAASAAAAAPPAAALCSPSRSTTTPTRRTSAAALPAPSSTCHLCATTAAPSRWVLSSAGSAGCRLGHPRLSKSEIWSVIAACSQAAGP